MSQSGKPVAFIVGNSYELIIVFIIALFFDT